MARTTLQTSVYDQEYFSGSQVNIYIGDVLIDEVTALSVSVHQKKRPIYGYASQLFDNVSCGTVLVEGQFQINFKESGYLHTVLNRFERQKNLKGTPYVSPRVSSSNIGRPQVDGKNVGGAKLKNPGDTRGDPGVLFRKNIEEIDSRAVERIVSGKHPTDNRDLTPEEQIEYYQQMMRYHVEASGFNNQAGALPKSESTFERFEDQVWRNDRLTTGARRVDDQAFDGFTIYVTYGDFNRTDDVNHTVRRIDDVRLIGQAQEINIGGTPVGEAYSFFARNWV
jgi:hypothetical protein